MPECKALRNWPHCSLASNQRQAAGKTLCHASGQLLNSSFKSETGLSLSILELCNLSLDAKTCRRHGERRGKICMVAKTMQRVGVRPYSFLEVGG